MRRLFITALLFSLIRTVYAHAILVKAVPAPYQVVDGSDVTIRLQFNSRIDAKRSRLSIISASGDDRTLQISATSTPDCIDSKVTRVPGGAYVLRWQVLAADGHISRGEVPFHVREK